MITFDNKSFVKDMNNIIKYSYGFVEGVESGKKVFLNNLGKHSIDQLKESIDAMAKVDPAMLHHVYEWNKTGSPNARLFDIEYTVSNLGLSFKSSFSQSISIKNGSKVPFYNKAKIMENGLPVVIKPKNSKVLAFNYNGEQVFTSNQVLVENPGGIKAAGGFEKAFDTLFKFFSQSFLRSSGIAKYLENPVAFKSSLPAGRRGGKSVGVATGYKWIVNAGVLS